jgi:hypothetical protein
MDSEVGMFNEKICNPSPFVPAGIIHPDVDDSAPEELSNPLEQLQEPVRIPLDPFHHAMPSIQRIDPTEEIQPLLVLTTGIHIGLSSLLGPHSAQLRMKGKTRFILKKNDPFASTPPGEVNFFLLLHEIPSRLLLLLGQTDKSAAVRSIQAFVSDAGHDEHECLCGKSSSDIPTQPPRPSELRGSHIFEEIAIKLPPSVSLSPRQIGMACLNGAGHLPIQFLHDSLFVSTSRQPNGLSQTNRQPGKTSSRITPTVMLRHESQSMLQASYLLSPKVVPWLCLHAIWSVLSLATSRFIFLSGGIVSYRETYAN